jgi:hypothetical protein
MTWTAPRTWAALERLTAALMNTHLRDNLLALSSPPQCQAYKSTDTTITTGSTSLIAFDAETYDQDWGPGSTGSMHSTSTNTSRIVIPYDGIYRVRWFWQTTAAAGTGLLNTNARVNAAGSDTGGSSIRTWIGGADRTAAYEVDRAFTAGDYVELFVKNLTAGSITVSGGNYVTGMTVRYIGA